MNFKSLIAMAALAVAASPSFSAVTLYQNASFDNDAGRNIPKALADNWTFTSSAFKVGDNSNVSLNFSFTQNKNDKDGSADSVGITLFERISGMDSFIASEFVWNQTSKKTFSDTVIFNNSFFAKGKTYRFAFNGYTPNFEGNFKYNVSAVAPIPEPETYALMGMGLVGLIAARRRKAKQA